MKVLSSLAYVAQTQDRENYRISEELPPYYILILYLLLAGTRYNVVSEKILGEKIKYA